MAQKFSIWSTLPLAVCATNVHTSDNVPNMIGGFVKCKKRMPDPPRPPSLVIVVIGSGENTFLRSFLANWCTISAGWSESSPDVQASQDVSGSAAAPTHTQTRTYTMQIQRHASYRDRNMTPLQGIDNDPNQEGNQGDIVHRLSSHIIHQSHKLSFISYTQGIGEKMRMMRLKQITVRINAAALL